MRHVLSGNNIGLIATRITKDEWDCLVTKNICGHKSCAAYDINTIFPLYLYDITGKACSLTCQFITGLEKAVNLVFIDDGRGDLQTTVGPEDIFYYAYAVFHSPTYRNRYAAFLKIDFPRLPLTSNQTLFRRLCSLGAELTALHLLECDAPAIASYPVAGTNRVDTVRYAEPTAAAPGRVWINAAQYFQGIPRKSGISTLAVIKSWPSG